MLWIQIHEDEDKTCHDMAQVKDQSLVGLLCTFSIWTISVFNIYLKRQKFQIYTKHIVSDSVCIMWLPISVL